MFNKSVFQETVSNKEHNNDIVDEILSDIRKSKFVLADLTGHRGV
jgi:hypothetical protein